MKSTITNTLGNGMPHSAYTCKNRFNVLGKRIIGNKPLHRQRSTIRNSLETIYYTSTNNTLIKI